MRVLDLTGPALDWAVAKCEGEDYSPTTTYSGIGHEFPPTNYSTDWSVGGPIIEREKLSVEYFPDGSHEGGGMWLSSRRWRRDHNGDGPTALIAAMRCFVASRLGDEVDIPEELCN